MADSEHFFALLSSLSEKQPNQQALCLPDKGQTWSFADLQTLANQLAEELRKQGVQSQDRVLIAFPNNAEFVVALLAISKLHAVVVPVSPHLHKNEAKAIITDSKAYFVLSNQKREEIDSQTESIELSINDNLSFWLTKQQTRGETQHHEPKLAMLKYTSGTTGTPKGVMLTNSQILQEGKNVVETLELTQKDVLFAGAALFHSYGFDFCLMPMLLTGAKLILFENNLPRRWMRTLQEEKVTLFPTVPRMLQLLTKVKQEHPVTFPHLRFCISATAPLSARTARRFYETFGVVVCQNYGSSEAGAITLEIRRKPDIPSTCLGKSLKNVRLIIRNEANQQQPDGTIGEVWVGGQQVAQGYYHDPNLTQQYFVEGLCRTGDLGYLDEKGNLFLTGRKKDFINSGGKKIAPREIESVLEQHPAITEVAVVGVEDEALGETIKACIVTEQSLSQEELLSFCQAYLAPHKIPQKWHFLTQLPRNQAGKIDKEKLKG